MRMPVGPLLCVIDGRTRGRPWASDAARAQLRRVAAKAGARRRFAPHQLRHAHAVELAHEGVPLNVIQPAPWSFPVATVASAKTPPLMGWDTLAGRCRVIL
jgi:hypothetical protein